MSERTVPEVRFRGFCGEWEKREIGKIAKDTFGGGTPSTAITKYWSGNIPWIQSSDLIEHNVRTITIRKSITTLALKNSAAKLVPSGSIAIVTRVGVGKIALINQQYSTSQDFISLSNIDVDTMFATYSIHKKLQWVLCEVQGTSIKGITKDELLNKIIDIPICETEQGKIGTFFKNLDDLIVQNQKKYNKLVNMKKACLDKMFPKDGADTPEVRFKGFCGKWEGKKLESTVDFLDEQRKPISAEARESGIYPYYGASGIIDYVKDYLFSEELVLLSEDGANIIDRNYRVSFLAKGKYWVNNHAHVLKSMQGYCNGFICEALESLNYERYNTGTAQPKLNQEVCRNIIIMVPTVEEQQQIFVFSQTLDNLIALRKTELEKLKNIKKACLDKMFI